MHWSHPSYRAETELLWNFGVSTSRQYLQSCLKFHQSLSGCSALAENRQCITDLSIFCRDMSYFDGLYLKKSRSACSCLGQNIYFFFGPDGAQLGAPWWSTLRAASRSSWHLILRYLVNTRIWAESTELSRFPPPRVEFCSPRASRIFERAITQLIMRDDPWHHINQLCIRALTSAHAFAAATCCARPRACRHRSLNILKACEPMGFSSRRLLLLLASYCMALTRERKNPSRIARQIEIFSTWIFASLVPTLVPKHNSRFLVFRSTICWSWCMMIDKHLLYI